MQLEEVSVLRTVPEFWTIIQTRQKKTTTGLNKKIRVPLHFGIFYFRSLKARSQARGISVAKNSNFCHQKIYGGEIGDVRNVDTLFLGRAQELRHVFSRPAAECRKLRLPCWKNSCLTFLKLFFRICVFLRWWPIILPILDHN